MTPAVFTLILTAAFLHALWNALVKGAADKTLMLGLIALGHVIPGAVILAAVGLPSYESYPYILASTIIHWVYYGFLNIAYRTGDLSVVYPISRGVAPVLVALGAQFWIGEVLPLYAWLGILSISIGICVLSVVGAGAANTWTSLLAALGTGVMIAGYSLADGIGVRLSGNAFAYIGLLFTAEIFVAIGIFTLRFERLGQASKRTFLLGLLGGVVSGTAYAMVLYAKQFAPLGIVSALRETSVICAAVIGVMWFKEGPKNNRLSAATLVALGVVVLGAST